MPSMLLDARGSDTQTGVNHIRSLVWALIWALSLFFLVHAGVEEWAQSYVAFNGHVAIQIMGAWSAL